MDIISDALRQAFMPKLEYESLQEEDKAWHRLQRPLMISILTFISLSIVISTLISVKIVFPGNSLKRPFCNDVRIQPLSINFTAAGGGGGADSDISPGAFYLTDQETIDFYWIVVFLPSSLIFFASVPYLISGICVAYNAPTRHWCLNMVENNFCASRRGGEHCLSILNLVFAIIFGLLALFLGSTLLTLGSSCSTPLFWCYEIASWGLVILYGGTAFFLRRQAVVILDEGNFSGRNVGVEMFNANTVEFSPELESRVSEGFKAWMGPSYLSSDEDEEPANYLEEGSLLQTNSSQERDSGDV